MKKKWIVLSLSLLSFILFTNCSSNDSNDDVPSSNDNLYTQVLKNEANIMTTIYSDLAQKSKLLKKAVDNLTIGDEAALQKAKDAWVATRSPWEKSEAFLKFGPVENDGIDPAIDSWPVNVTEIDAIFNSGIPITEDLLEHNDETRGFHTLEYYLWGVNGNKKATDFTNRELEYLRAVASDLEKKTEYLYDVWKPSGKNYSGIFTTEVPNKDYPSKITSFGNLMLGFANISDEVSNQKIGTPLKGNNGNPQPEKEESRFSNNSKLDYSDNIRSIQYIYLGKYDSQGYNIQGKGLTDIVSQINPALDKKMKAKIEECISVIEGIPGTFTNAIYNNKPAVEKAENSVAELNDIIEKELKPLFSNLKL